MPKAMCSAAGCSEILNKPGKCFKHTREADQRVHSHHRRQYYRRTWEHTREAVIARDLGLCQACLNEGITKLGNDVDHIVKALDRPDLFHEMSNLQLLCHSCHSEKTARGE